jgi:pSer/pThr/pTyr-binding forkhead associated (FHA) protein
MAPEQWEDEGIDARCDIWALGATLYHLLAGHPPFQGDTMDDVADAIMDGDCEPLEEAVSGVPPELALVIAQMLMTDRKDRYPRMEDAAEDFERVLRGERARVPCLEGPGGARAVLLEGEWFTMGSDVRCELTLADPSVAPKHAQLRREGGGFALRDLKSPSGTSVEGEILTAGRARALRDGERIRVGQVEVVFRDPWGEAEQAGASWLQDVERREVADPLVEALAQLGDPHAVLWLLEHLVPERAGTEDDRLLTKLLGGETARAVAERRAAMGREAAAAWQERLQAATNVREITDPAGWLAWWHQVRGTAPPQAVPKRHPQDARLRVTGGHPALDLPLAGQSVVLVGRDERCQLRLQIGSLPRLATTVLRLHRRRVAVDEGSHATALNGQPVRAAFLDVGDQLTLGGAVQLALDVNPGEVLPVGPRLYPVEPETFDALMALGHLSVTMALVGLLREPAQLDWAAEQVRGVFPDAPDQIAAVGQALRARVTARAQAARALLPKLVGSDLGDDPAAWGNFIASRSGQLPPQVAPWGWLAFTRE